MWGLIIELGVAVGLWVLNKFLNSSDPPRPPVPQEFKIATTAEGVNVPLVYGTTRVDNPILFWHGNHKVYGNGQGSPYLYSSDMIFVIGIPMYNNQINGQPSSTTLRRVWWGNVIELGSDTANVQDLGKVTVALALGGQGAGGDAVGTRQFYAGGANQNVPANGTVANTIMSIAGLDMTQAPGMRNMCAAAYQMITIGESPRLPQISFEISSCCVGAAWGLPDDANPAWVIYDLITGPVWKIGVPVGDVDAASFAACAATLNAEQHGYSNSLDRSTDATKIIVDILKQVDGLLYQNPNTGLITMRLIRNDYGPVGGLPQITIDNTIGRPQYTTTEWRSTYNQVKILYRDRANNYQQGSIIAHRLGNIAAQDQRIRSLDITFDGVCTAQLATTLAAREMASAGRPVATAKCVVNRSFYNVMPGDAVAVTWPAYGLTQKIMRVMQVDPGQLANGDITLTLVEDVFAATQGAYNPFTYTIVSTPPLPLTKRIFMECPRFLAQQVAAQTVGISPEIPLTFCIAKPDDAATSYACKTQTAPLNVAVALGKTNVFQPDIIDHVFPPTGTLVNNYPRENEPYDTTSNLLVVQNLTASLAGVDLSTLAWQTDGTFLLLVVEASGAMEFMMFESATNLGGGQFRLNNVWRGLLDTSPIAHLAGATAYFLTTLANVGTVSYKPTNQANSKTIRGQTYPRRLFSVGCGKDQNGNDLDPVDQFTMSFRAIQPYQPADVRVGSDYQGLTGTLGIPAVAGQFKSVTRLEEGFNIYGRTRDRRTAAPPVRGDAAIESVASDNIGLYATIVDPGTKFQTASFLTADGSAAYGPSNWSLNNPLQNDSTQDIIAGGDIAGFGTFDLCVFEFKQIQTNDPLSALLAITPGATPQFYSLNPARVSITAPCWRNLLQNARWNYYNGTTQPSDVWWDNEVGNAGTAVFLASGIAGAPNALGTSSAACVRKQRAQLTSLNNGTGAFLGGTQDYKCPNLSAIACAYFADAAGSTDNASLQIESLNKNGAQVATATNSITGLTTANFAYKEQALGVVLASGVQFVRCGIGVNKTSGSGSMATEAGMYVGQFYNNTTRLLVNDSFDSNAASWTVGAGSWTGGVTTNKVLSPGYVACLSTGSLFQDFTIPAGYEYSTAIVRVWVDQFVAGNTFSITVAALDASNNVLASSTTGAISNATFSGWYRKTVNIDSVDGAVKYRVTLAATFVSGTATAFDDCFLMLQKQIGAVTSQTYTFDTPTAQQMPQTTPGYHLAYPNSTAGVPAQMFSGYPDAYVEWSDFAAMSGARGTGTMTGQFGGSLNASTFSYQLTRTHAGSQIYLEPTGAQQKGASGTTGAFTAANSFTVLTYYRADESPWQGFCGLIGRANAQRGWYIGLDGSGRLQAVLRGTGAVFSIAQSNRSSVEGAFHMAAIVYDSVGQTVSVYDELGLAGQVSTANTPDFASVVTDLDCFFRIGAGAPDFDTFPGMIGPIMFWNAALSATQVASHWNYCKDPTGLISTYTRSASVVVPLYGGYACIMSPQQYAIAYNANLTLDGGTGFGLAIGEKFSNVIPDVTFTSANWALAASATMQTGITDCTGRPRGAQITGNATNGIKVQNVPLAASPTSVVVAFWAQAISGNTTVNVNLRTASSALKSTTAVALTNNAVSGWSLYTATLGSWDGSTPTAQIEFVSSSGAMVFALAGVICITQGTDIPMAFPLSGTTNNGTNVTVSGTFAKQLSYEGEIWVQGVSAGNSPAALGTLCRLWDGVDNKNLRELQMAGGSTGFTFVHYDAGSPSPISNSCTIAYSTYASRVWKARGRWCQAGILDASLPQTDVAWNDDTHTPAAGGITNGRVAQWSTSPSSLTTAQIGYGTAAPQDFLMRAFTIRAREEKLFS